MMLEVSAGFRKFSGLQKKNPHGDKFLKKKNPQNLKY